MSPPGLRPGEPGGEEFALVADAVELDVDARAADQGRDLDIERRLMDAVGRIRAGDQLRVDQIPMVADVIELNLDERCGDARRDPDAERSLERALATLRR